MKFTPLTAAQLDRLGDRYMPAVADGIDKVLAETAARARGHYDLQALAVIPTLWAQQVDVQLLADVAAAYWAGVNGAVDPVARALVASAVTDAAHDPGNPATDDIGIARVSNVAAEQYLAGASNRLVRIGDEVWMRTQQQLLEGMIAGEGVGELRHRIVDRAAGISLPRAEVIARTEINGAANAGTIAQVRAFGVPGDKTWRTAGDGRVRDDHGHAEGQKVRIDAHFMVGGEAMDRPHDPNGSPGNVINCRCVLEFDLDDDELDQAAAPLTADPLLPLSAEQYSALDPARSVSERNIEKLLNVDKQGRDVLTAIRSFTQRRGGVANLRKAIDQRASGEQISDALAAKIDAFTGAMNGYPIERVPQLYRGFAIEFKTANIDPRWFNEFEAKYAPGNDLHLNASSFTSSERVAKGFQSSIGGTREAKAGRHVQVRVVVDGPMHALPVERLSKFASEKEWIGGGHYKITALHEPTGKRVWYEMHIKQVTSLGQGTTP
jgi:hypothetical protein